MIVSRYRFTGALVALAALIIVAAPDSSAQESASYSMNRITVTAVGQTVDSANYETSVVLCQETLSGAASFCNAGYVHSMGFWSVLGDLPVPIRLRVDKRPGDPSVVDLSWTGADDVFQMYRSTAADDVLDPVHLNEEIADCSTSDSQAGAASLIFYRIKAKPEE